VVLILGIVTTCCGCHRDPERNAERQAPRLAAKTASVAAAAPALAASARKSVAGTSQRRTAKGRVIAIGDLHGDLGAARRALRVAKVIDNNDAWIGGDTTLVQTGDLLDRGNEERPLLELFEHVAASAEKAGGALLRLNGNHEVMNVAGDMRYVTEPGFVAFAEYAQGTLPAALRDAPPLQRGRLAAFFPGGPWARRLSEYPIVLIVNDTVFTHGGLLMKHVEYGLERMNSDVSAWMRGTGRLSSLLAGDEAPYWVRNYGENVSDADCQQLGEVLGKLAVKRLVIGHTPQQHGVTFACERRVARIDVGLSSFYGNNPAAVLEIDTNGERVLVESTKPHAGNGN
jgi:hypothetical protein